MNINIPTMRFNKLFTLFLLLLPFSSFSDKIEKKGTLLNSACKPIGTKCTASVQTEFHYTFICNEPRPGSFALQIAEDEINRDPSLQKFFKTNSRIGIDEAMPIPDDVSRIMKKSVPYLIPPGMYNITQHQQFFLIIFKE